MIDSTIISEKIGKVVKIILNRPERRNTITWEMVEKLVVLLDKCGRDMDARAIIITGAGNAFCAGDDMMGFMPDGALRQPSEYTFREIDQGIQRIWRAIMNLSKPVIAMVNGLAEGGGFGICLACDYRIAAENATFRYPYVAHLGAAAGMELLPQYVGIGKAFEILTLGEQISAREAEYLGLVNRVVPDEQLEEIVIMFANRLASGATKAIGYVKEALNQKRTESFEFCANKILESLRTEDVKEGLKAFIDKRQPKFEGR